MKLFEAFFGQLQYDKSSWRRCFLSCLGMTLLRTKAVQPVRAHCYEKNQIKRDLEALIQKIGDDDSCNISR